MEAACWRRDGGTGEAERSGQDDGVLGVDVSQVEVEVEVHCVHTYSGLVEGAVER